MYLHDDIICLAYIVTKTPHLLICGVFIVHLKKITKRLKNNDAIPAH
jgi:hypothetical protein